MPRPGGYWPHTLVMYRAMEKRELSSRALGRVVGVDGSMIRRMLSGDRSCSRPVAAAIAEALDVPIDDLFFARGVHRQ